MAATREIIIYLVYPNDHKIEIYSWETKHEKKSVKSDIQTLRSGLKKRGAAEFFLTNFEVNTVCFDFVNTR